MFLVAFASAIALAISQMVMVGIPQSVANRHVRGLRTLVTRLAAVQALLAMSLLCWFSGQQLAAVGDVPRTFTGFQYDAVGGLMLSLISFIGWVVSAFSVRYLDGDVNQGRFFRWIAFTVGSVSLMVLADNLALFFATWLLTSVGLHRLLLHHADRPLAQKAAWLKFSISRLGDAALLAATGIYLGQFQVLRFEDIARQAAIANPEQQVWLYWAASLLVIGAITKSAQFPFHVWLPISLDTPTPVSALMHAGIVNAGGFLIVRASPVLAATPEILTLLLAVGGFTACFGAVVMMAQTSVKRKLTYSTIAQMGFMLMQCGLGAFSAAMLHIIAHSLYKAHAFLSSGSVVAERAGLVGARKTNQWASGGLLAAIALASGASTTAMFWLLGVNIVSKPGGWFLVALMSLALTFWIGKSLVNGGKRLAWQACVWCGVLVLAYTTSFAAVDWLVADSVAKIEASWLTNLFAASILLGFLGMFWLHSQLIIGQTKPWFGAMYVHAANGFYIETLMGRLLVSPARS